MPPAERGNDGEDHQPFLQLQRTSRVIVVKADESATGSLGCVEICLLLMLTLWYPLFQSPYWCLFRWKLE